MKFISIDGGFKNLGVAVWQNNELLDSWVWSFRDRGETEPFSVYRDNGVLTRYHQFTNLGEYDMIVAETMPMQSLTIQRALTLSVMVAIRVMAFQRNITWNEISAVTVKKTLTGSGKATKAQMRRKITELYPHIVRGRKLGDIKFDEADAIAVGHTWIGKNG